MLAAECLMKEPTQSPYNYRMMCGSKVDSAFHPSEVDKMSTRNFWELSAKK